MTGEELKAFTTSLLDGDEMDDTPFYTMANAAKTMIEGIRDWRQLLTTDTSKTALSSDTYLTTKALPTRFIKFENSDPIQLVALDNTDEVLCYKPSPFAQRQLNKQKQGLFYTDMKNSAIGLIGDLSKTYTIHMNFIEESPAITEDDGWTFPARYHPIIAYMVSGMQKGGVDYDDIFARMAPENRAQAQMLLNMAITWDDDLQRQESGY